MLEEKIISLKKELIGSAALVENMIEKTIKGLIQEEKEILLEAIKVDEPKANQQDIRLDEMCTNLIAQYQPAAKSLRTILMVLKINKDLERIADHTVNIAESSLYLIERPPVKPLIDIPKMAGCTIEMLKDSIDSFVNEDVILAKDVCARDNTVDNFKSQILEELISFMTSDTSTIERSLHLIRISNNLERIADLSTNICEDVIYMVDGKVIKHRKYGRKKSYKVL